MKQYGKQVSSLKQIKAKIANNNDKEIYSGIFEYTKMTLDLEEKREQSLISQSSRMLTAFSISTGVLFVIYKIVREDGAVSVIFLNTVTIICMLLFIASMVLALIVSWRYKYKSLSSPREMMEHIVKNKEYFLTSEQRDKSFTETLDEIWKIKKGLNDRRAYLVTASMIAYFLSIGIAVIALFIVLIKNIL